MSVVLTFKGRWNAVSNEYILTGNTIPTGSLQDGSGTTGDCYIIYNLQGTTSYNVYDRDLGSGTKSWISLYYIYYTGSVWDMVGDTTGGGGGGVTSVSGTPNRITSTEGTTPVIDISAVFEALLGKVASPLSQFAATTSAQLAGVISDETGSGALVFATSPSLGGTIILADGTVISGGTGTGTTLLANTGQKLGFFGTTPVIFQNGNIPDALANYGLIGSGTIDLETDVTGILPAANGGDPFTYYYVSGGDFSTSSATLVDITGLVTGTLALSTSYEFEIQLQCAVSAVNTGVRAGVNCTEAPTRVGIIVQGAGTTGVLTGSTSNVNNSAGPVNMLTTASLTGVVIVKGLITTAGSGNPVFSARIQKQTSGTVTVFEAGSFMRIKISQ